MKGLSTKKFQKNSKNSSRIRRFIRREAIQILPKFAKQISCVAEAIQLKAKFAKQI